ncbi:transfer protein spdA [Streptomyces sp. NBC_01764]|uniref:transfer protein spdA n=1 Tax=Streptomyces sp. NBC_01764 TaxID=2975935 RepID=UPI00224DABE3|nr:transfer protein spdA [Streptomyces sp. NBC_01764]MCX4400815.1 transfer protein spdA [Streptomyces sp. NBC_01764]
MKFPSVANIARYAALGASMAISFAVERDLALSHGVPVAVTPAVPVAVDLFMIWAVRTRRDVSLAVAVAVSANVAGVLTAESLSAVDTWVSAALHAVFPLTVWRMHRTPVVAPVSVSDVPADSEATDGRYVAAEKRSQPFPDDLWQDFENSAPDVVDDDRSTPDSEPDTADSLPPSTDAIRAAIHRLSAGGRKVTGPMLGDHFGVSARTGRRYMALAAA